MSMRASDIPDVVRSELLGGFSMSSTDGDYRLRLPFRDAAGEPIEMKLTPGPGGLALDDLGHTAGLLFELGQHHEDSPGHLLARNLSEAYGIEMDYDRGILSKLVLHGQGTGAISDFAKVLVAIHTVTPELPSRRRERRSGTRLSTRVGREIRQLRLYEYMQRSVEVDGVLDRWHIDFRYRRTEDHFATEVLIVAADLNLREPRQKAEHIITLGLDLLAVDTRRDLRVVYELNGNGTSRAARTAASMLVRYQQKVGYKAFNYANPEQRSVFKSTMLDELVPTF